MAKRAAKRAGYETYEYWYKKYSSTGAMKEKKLSEEGWAALKRDAKRAGISTVNFSRTLASRQRAASSLQLRVTWGIAKEKIGEAKGRVEIRKAQLRETIQKERKASGKRRLSARNLEKRIEKILAEEMPDDISLVSNYGDITWQKFKFVQKDVLEKARKTVESREEWEEAFDLAYDSPKEE